MYVYNVLGKTGRILMFDLNYVGGHYYFNQWINILILTWRLLLDYKLLVIHNLTFLKLNFV